MKRLIVNADDFGYSDHTVEWTIKGFEIGALTSASLMANMPATTKAIAYALNHPQYSFGVHFYLVDEKPVSNPCQIKSMVDPRTGKLWTTRNFIVRNFAGLIKVEDIVTEMTAQYNLLIASGLRVSHFDGHGHNHRLPQSIKALRVLRALTGVETIRRCQDVFCGRPGLLSRLINSPMQKRLEKEGFRMADHFAMNAGHILNTEWYSNLLHNLPDGTTEVGVHPGNDEEWRTVDIKACFERGREIATSCGVELISYKGL